MKVLIVNTYDKGGAANACKRLHYGLLLKEITSQILVRFKENNWNKSDVFVPMKNTLLDIKRKIVKRILKEFRLYRNKQHQFLRERARGLELFSFPNSDCDITEHDFYRECDIINLHWVANFLDFITFFEKNKKPVVWTLHDMNPFTGGEHYLESFLGIDEAGYPIKRNLSNEEINVADENLALKKEVLSKISNLTVVAPSKWLAEEARKSEVFKNVQIHCIPNGLNTSIYSPRDKNYSRELLNLPKNKKIILFVSDSISNNRKGFVFLKRAFERLEDSNLILCAIGSKKTDLVSIQNVLELGPIYDERLMSAAYSAADVFVIPSLMDNLPNTVLEALLCGTPVIGFPVGGIIDMIQDGENGFLAEDISVNSLVIALKNFLKNTNCFDINKIRQNAVEKYDESVQSQKYIDLFTTILKSSKDKNN
ncbi:MAG: glycosyltransferase [bacterium]|nr:glycosyltransferase [bacterium]